MGTFIVSYIGNGFVQSLVESRLLSSLSYRARRRSLVLIYFTAIVSILTLFGVLTIPDLIREGSDFVQRLQSENIWVVVLEKMRHGLGDGLMDQLERVLLVASGEDFATLAAGGETQVDSSPHAGAGGHAAETDARVHRGCSDVHLQSCEVHLAICHPGEVALGFARQGCI